MNLIRLLMGSLKVKMDFSSVKFVPKQSPRNKICKSMLRFTLKGSPLIAIFATKLSGQEIIFVNINYIININNDIF